MVNEELLAKYYDGDKDRYAVSAIWDEEVKPDDPYDDPLTIIMFSDDEAVAMKEIKYRSPTTFEAMQRNEEAQKRDDQEIERQAAKLIAKFDEGQRLTNQEINFLVETGYAHNEYNDPDSNRPTHFVIGKRPGDGKPHADWETEEELAHLGL